MSSSSTIEPAAALPGRSAPWRVLHGGKTGTSPTSCRPTCGDEYEERFTCDQLRDAAEEHHLTVAPDPATHKHCTIGG